MLVAVNVPTFRQTVHPIVGMADFQKVRQTDHAPQVVWQEIKAKAVGRDSTFRGRLWKDAGRRETPDRLSDIQTLRRRSCGIVRRGSGAGVTHLASATKGD